MTRLPSIQRIVVTVAFCAAAAWFGIAVDAHEVSAYYGERSVEASHLPGATAVTGEAELVVAPDGRAGALIVDAGRDGIADLLLVLRSEESSRGLRPSNFGQVTVTHSSGRVYVDGKIVAALHPGQDLDAYDVMQISSPPLEGLGVLRTTTSIREVMTVGGAPFPFAFFEDCQSGGPNSSSCQVTSSESGCSVDCDEGYYACCNCELECTCDCTKDPIEA